MCYAYGRGHYRTFDGNNYYFYGTCKYQMVYVKDSLIRFSVSLINDPNCDINAPCEKKVEVVMEDAVVMLGRKGLNGIPHVTINDQVVNIPYKKRTPSIRMVSYDVLFVVCKTMLITVLVTSPARRACKSFFMQNVFVFKRQILVNSIVKE